MDRARCRIELPSVNLNLPVLHRFSLGYRSKMFAIASIILELVGLTQPLLRLVYLRLSRQ